MLAIFKKGTVQPPTELNSPAPFKSGVKPAKMPEEIVKDFSSSNPGNSMSFDFSNSAVIAFSQAQKTTSSHQRMFCGVDGIYCTFIGSLHNLSGLIKQYGLSKSTNEAMFVIEAYRTLRDRSPYPADQVLKELDGSYGFVIYDSTVGTAFVSLSADDGVKLYWGVAADGSVVICDNKSVVKGGCAKSYAPFPAGCMFHSVGGLKSFEHPTKKMKAMPRVDSEGFLCGSSFKVDTFSKINTMPRVGSAANWEPWSS
ncbi:hypothetical protein QQ045_032423 [Rhodiola kirilowii]